MIIYTSYFGLLDKIQKIYPKALKYSIARYTPDYAAIPELVQLMPSKRLQKYGKQHGLGDSFRRRFMQQLIDTEAIMSVKHILRLDVDKLFLFCHEKNVNECHRSVVGIYFRREIAAWVSEWNEVQNMSNENFTLF